MSDPAIKDFLAERKAMWLKKKINPSMETEVVKQLETDADQLFSLPVWLPDAAKRAGQLSLVSHPAKFSHPGAKASPIIANAPYRPDGLLRSGNVDTELDVLGNAAAMDVYKFLMLEMQDGQTILAHLEDDTDTIRQQFKMDTASFDELSAGLLAIKGSGTASTKTSGSIKQVYFPVNNARDEYHLLSVLTPSSMMFTLKSRINTLRYSDETKAAREARKAGKAHETGYAEIYNLSAIGFGGTKPQNISVLNSRHGGVSLLLESMPPQLEQRRVNPPRDSFFGAYLNPKFYQDAFNKLFVEVLREVNNQHVRNQIQWQCKTIFYQMIAHAWEVRRLPEGWSDSDHYDGLPMAQKIWLDRQHLQKRSDTEDREWLDTIKRNMARWFVQAYNALLDSADSPVHTADRFKIKDYEFRELIKWLDDCEESLL